FDANSNAALEFDAAFGIRHIELKAAGNAKVDRNTAIFAKLLYECRIHAHALDSEIQPARRFYKLAAGRQHAGAGGARLAAERSGVVERNSGTRLCKTPGDGRANQSRADDGHVVSHGSIFRT